MAFLRPRVIAMLANDTASAAAPTVAYRTHLVS
jgi:hypothetical protein